MFLWSFFSSLRRKFHLYAFKGYVNPFAFLFFKIKIFSNFFTSYWEKSYLGILGCSENHILLSFSFFFFTSSINFQWDDSTQKLRDSANAGFDKIITFLISMLFILVDLVCWVVLWCWRPPDYSLFSLLVPYQCFCWTSDAICRVKCDKSHKMHRGLWCVALKIKGMQYY